MDTQETPAPEADETPETAVQPEAGEVTQPVETPLDQAAYGADAADAPAEAHPAANPAESTDPDLAGDREAAPVAPDAVERHAASRIPGSESPASTEGSLQDSESATGADVLDAAGPAEGEASETAVTEAGGDGQSATAHDLEAMTAEAETAADTPAELRVAEMDSELTPEQLLMSGVQEPAGDSDEARKLAVLEAIVYVTDEPLTLAQIAAALGEPPDQVRRLLDRLTAEFNRPEHGLTVKEVAGGYKMATKPEHHEAVRLFVKNLNPPLKLSLAALETLAVIAYKQPITAPEIMEIRGVQGAGVLKTLLDRKLITTSGRKQVVGKPILYKTTKEFLVQFGLKDLTELPTLKEFEDLRRMAFSEEEIPAPQEATAQEDTDAVQDTDATESNGPTAPEPEEPAAETANTAEPSEHAVAHEGGSGEE